jgi:arylsulfatase A
VRQIVATLDEFGIRHPTAIVFASDNGGLAGMTDNRLLRAGKGSVSEGHVRVPFVVSWPGVMKPESTSDVLRITPDIPAAILATPGIGPVTA